MSDTLEEIPVGSATYVSCADTAKLVRDELKAAFPGRKFSVRSKTYSGPTGKDVDAIVGKFAGASFDGMKDLKSYHESRYRGQRLHFGSNYVFTNRSISDTWRDEILAKFEQVIGRDLGDPDSRDFSWWQQVPLAVQRFGDDAGELLHMVESCQEDLSTVYHQFVSFRTRP
jgi:hypothetical protein